MRRGCRLQSTLRSSIPTSASDASKESTMIASHSPTVEENRNVTRRGSHPWPTALYPLSADQREFKNDDRSVESFRTPGVAAGFIHLGVARGITSVLRQFGCDPEEIIAQADLDPRLFDDPDNVISA